MMSLDRSNYRVYVRGTNTGGFYIETFFSPEVSFKFPEDGDATLEEVLAGVLELVEEMNLDFEKQVHIPVYDIYHSKDNSRAIQFVREMVRRNPEVLATMKEDL
jgi:hypothetical protein